MDLSIVFPMFWGREKSQIYLEEDQFYDHPTALDDDGTIPPLFESLQILDDRDFDLIVVAGANNPSYQERVEEAAKFLLEKHAEEAGVQLHYFSYSHMERLHEYLRSVGKGELTEAVSLVGYSPLRNACLISAHILGKEVAVSIDDDCVFIDSEYISRIKKMMGMEFDGKPIRAYCGPYLTEQDTIYLEQPTRPYTNFWNVIEVMNEAFRKFIVDSPGLKEVPFAIMGNIAVHRDLYTRCPLDPPMQRGEDMDWVMNSHILGDRFVMDTNHLIKHCPAPRPYPVWRPLREDIYRFRYQQAKIKNSRDGEGHSRLDRDRYLPYPGSFFQDDFIDRVTNACTLLAMEYLTENNQEDAKEALNNILHARILAEPKVDPFEGYLRFQQKWEALMEHIDSHRDEVREKVFQ